VFGRHSDLGDGSGRADRQGGQRSTQIVSANSALMPRRALQTWQMTLLCWLSSLMRCCSQNPISRRRRAISGEAQSCLIRQAVPTRSLLSGQTKDSPWPWATFTDGVFLLTARHGKVIETRLQEGILRRRMDAKRIGRPMDFVCNQSGREKWECRSLLMSSARFAAYRCSI